MKSKLFGSILIAALAFTTIAEAQTKTPLINARERNHIARIHEGVNTGTLTRKETRRLVKRENHLRKDVRKAKADGYVSPKENSKLLRKQARINRAIIRKKTNGRTRY